MSVDTFIPEIWSARIMEKLNNDLVYANLLNRNYEGEIRNFGDTVHIGSIGNVSVKKYTKNTEIADPDALTATDQTLVIDQSEYFNFAVDDVDKVQTNVNLIDAASASAAYEFGAATDKYVAGLLAKGIIKDKTTMGDDTTPLQVTAANAYDTLVHMAVALNKANVPRMGRWVVVPPEFEGMMLLDDRFVKAGVDASEQRLQNAVVARAAGFDIYVSNNVPNTTNTKYKVIASTNICGSFADQILKTEAYRPDKRFADAVKGLHVYGAKVLRPEAVAVATVNFTAGA